MTAVTYRPTDPELREEMISTVRGFVARDVIPVASELEHADEYPADIVATMKDLGLFGITIAEEYGKLALAIVENPMLNGGTIRLDGGQRFAPK